MKNPAKSSSHTVLALFALVLLSLCNAFIGSKEGLHLNTPLVLAAFIFSGISLLTLIRFWPCKQSYRIIIPLVIFQNLLFMPMLPGDDVHRYVWEGLVQNHNINPYRVAPNDPQLESLSFYWHEHINHPDKTAIYPPGMLLYFRLLAAIQANPGFFKLCSMLASLLTTLSLLPLLKRLGRHPKWVLLFGIHPLALISFAGEGHLDVYMLLALVWTLLAFFHKRYALMWLALALAFHTKYIGILLLPFLINRQSLKTCILLVPALALPFFAFNPIDGVFTSLNTFSTQMHFNGLLYESLWSYPDNTETLTLFCGLVFLALAIAIRLCNSHPIEGGLALITALLLCSPNVHFWYVAWLLPFMVFIPQRAPLYWSFSICVTFITASNYANGSPWELSRLHFVLEYIPVLILLGLALYRLRFTSKSMQDQPRRPNVKTVSVIIPVMNDAETLETALKSLWACDPTAEQVLVAHAGNDPETLAICEHYSAEHIPSAGGRGNQIAEAVQHALNDIVLVAHADMTFEKDLFTDIPQALNESGRIGGAVGSRFASQQPFVRIIGQLNRIRASWGGLSFGDQAQFFRRHALSFPAQPLMEDVELSMRLKEIERPLYLDRGIIVSDRSWKSSKNSKRALGIVLLVAQYLSERRLSPHKLNPHHYYERYYGRSVAPRKQ